MIEDRSRDYMNARRVAKVWNFMGYFNLMLTESLISETFPSDITHDIFNHFKS
jgi:hypothetical protein